MLNTIPILQSHLESIGICDGRDIFKGEVIIYQTADGLSKLEVNLQNETVWLSIDQMAELFQRDKSTISRHIKKSLRMES